MPDPQIVPFEVERTEIEGLRVLRMKQVTDGRGTLREFYRESAFREVGLPPLGPWVQVNLTETGQGGIRGLHAEAMAKLIAVVEGEGFGAYVDLRPGSATRGRVVTVRLVKGTQVLVPNGVGNGFQAVSPGVTQYLYCFDAEWQPGMAGSAVNPLDPGLAIPWPIPVDPTDQAYVSAKDASLPTLSEVLGGASADSR